MGVFIILDLVGFYILFEGVLGGGGPLTQILNECTRVRTSP